MINFDTTEVVNILNPFSVMDIIKNHTADYDKTHFQQGPSWT